MAVLFKREWSTGSGPSGNADRPSVNGAASSPAAPSDQQSNHGPSIDQIIRQRLVTAEFQAIIRIATGEIVAFESLARGPADSALAMPSAMFRAAAEVDKIAELEAVAHAAVRWTLQHARLDPAIPIFVNSHPKGLRAAADGSETGDIFPADPRSLQIVVEIAEQELVNDPLGTIAAMEFARQQGMRVAVDNVGASLGSLALIPFAQPDVIKLDPKLLSGPQMRAAQVISSLVSYTEQSRALVVAQGIEQEAQVRAALNTGATLGQGYFFSRPMTLPVAETPRDRLLFSAVHVDAEPQLSPFELVALDRPPTVVDSAMLQGLTRLLENTAEAANQPFVMLTSLPAGQPVSEAGLSRLRTLNDAASLLLILATTQNFGQQSNRLNIHRVDAKDGLRDEMVLAIVTPHMASLLAARRLDGPDGLYECVLTYDRQHVLRASRALLHRVTTGEDPAKSPAK